jgi:hypothetical protein
MAISFPRVHQVAPGQPFSSSNLVSLANGINARLVSGLAEPWRIAFYFYSALLQIRNPSGYLFPARGEFLEFYQSVLPTEAEWPLSPPGTEEGANIASFMPAFVFGAEALDLNNEAVRLSDPLAGGVPLSISSSYTAGSARYNWELGKYQRGAYDRTTGLIFSPTFTAARSHFAIVSAGTSEHGKSYGGYAPTPENLGECTAPLGGWPTTQVPPQKYVYFFTPTATGAALGLAVKTYDANCPSSSPDYVSTGVSFIYRFPWAFVVVLNSGAVEYLDTRFYIEGPYSGGNRLVKQDGEFPSRVLNHFASQFRGTDAQRRAQSVRNVGFDTQRFFTRQYALAPAHGLQTDAETVVADYQTYESTGARNIPVGTLLTNRITGATAHGVAEGFCIHSILAGAEKLSGSATVQVLDDGVVIGTVTLTPDATGHAEDVLVLDAPAVGSVTFKVSSGAALTDSAGGILIEPAELLSYLPQHHDWCLVLRLAGATLVPTNGTDGSGLDEDRAKEIGTDYWRWGALINQHATPDLISSEAAINGNAVMESARLLSKRVRLLNRHQLRAYAVENGKSVLWFTRYSYGYGLGAYQPNDGPPPTNAVPDGELSPGTIYVVGGTAGGTVDYELLGSAHTFDIGETFVGTSNPNYTTSGGGAVFLNSSIVAPPPITRPVNGDMFDGIGPATAPIASGSLLPGRLYRVTGATIGYDTAAYNAGSTFTATAVREFTGSGTVYEANGIKTLAEPNSYSNEWVLGLQLKGFRDSESSLWKPGAYSDYFGLSDRCQFYPVWNAAPMPASLNDHFAYGQKIWIAPELPTSYRYAEGTNPTATIDFYKSCRIYEPCLEVLRTENVTGEGNEDLVKVTLTGRLHAHEDAIAAGDISSAYSAWNLTTLDAETYRTDENGLRDYIAHLNGHRPTWKIGDAAADSVIQTYPDRPTATCFPHIYLVKLLEKPWMDDNTVAGPSDTKLEHDPMSTAELYLRLMCEGFVDGRTSETYGCATGIDAVYDYTWANVCFDANGLPWVPTLAATETTRLDSTKVRADAPKGFGVAPLTIAAAEHFNWLSRICNQLDKVRVMLPYEFQSRERSGFESVVVPIFDNNGATGGPSSHQGFYIGSPTVPALSFTGLWGNTTPTNNAVHNASLSSGSTINTTSGEIDWRYEPTDPDAIYAIPETWRDMIATDAAALLRKTTVIQSTTMQTLPTSAGATMCSARYWPSTAGYLAFDLTSASTNTCVIAKSGTLVSPRLGAQVFYYDDTGGASLECYGSAGNAVGIEPVVTDSLILQVPIVSDYIRYVPASGDFDPADFSNSDFKTS